MNGEQYIKVYFLHTVQMMEVPQRVVLAEIIANPNPLS